MTIIKIGDKKFIRTEATKHPQYWRVQRGYVDDRLARGLPAWDQDDPVDVLPEWHELYKPVMDITDPLDKRARVDPPSDEYATPEESDDDEGSRVWEPTMSVLSMTLAPPRPYAFTREEDVQLRRAEEVITRRNARRELARLDQILEEARLGDLVQADGAATGPGVITREEGKVVKQINR